MHAASQKCFAYSENSVQSGKRTAPRNNGIVPIRLKGGRTNGDKKSSGEKSRRKTGTRKTRCT
jgi:hypothetical protein